MTDANLANDTTTTHVTADEIEEMIKRVALAHFSADLAANNGCLNGGSWTEPVAYATDGMLSSIAADAEEILGRDDLDEIFEWGAFRRHVSCAYEDLADARAEEEKMSYMERKIAIGYDMDCGGYAPDDRGEGGFEVGDSDFREYVGLACTDYDYLRFHPHDYSDRAPETRIEDEEILIPVAHGWLDGSDHECWQCEGSGEADVSGELCDRCDGDGYVDSMGGRWVAYQRAEYEIGPVLEGTMRPVDVMHVLAQELDRVGVEIEPIEYTEDEDENREIEGAWIDEAITAIDDAIDDLVVFDVHPDDPACLGYWEAD